MRRGIGHACLWIVLSGCSLMTDGEFSVRQDGGAARSGDGDGDGSGDGSGGSGGTTPGSGGQGSDCDDSADDDGDGVANCDDGCPDDAFWLSPGICGCPSAPAPVDTPCDDGVCKRSSVCDGAGSCGSPMDCAPSPACTPVHVPSSAATIYFVCADLQMWTSARTRCTGVGVGFGLLRIDDADENADIAAMLDMDAWMAANDREVEGDWRWSEQEATTRFWRGNGDAAGGQAVAAFSAWAPADADAAAQPDDGDDADCGVLGEDGLWRDHPCSDLRPYVCEGPPRQ